MKLKLNNILLFVSCLGFLNPFLYGTRILILLGVVFFLNINKFLKYFNSMIFLVSLFTISYFLISYSKYENDLNILGLFSFLIAAISVYLYGEFLSSFKENYKILVLVSLSVFSSFGLVYSILEQVLLFGFDNGIRSMYLIWDRSQLISATVLGGFLVTTTPFLAVFFTPKKNRFEKRVSIIMLLYGTISMFCYLRLGSRTLLGLIIVNILITLLINRTFIINNFFKYSVSLLLLIISSVFFNIMPNINFNKYFKDREEASNAGIASAGGRTDKWDKALGLMVEKPFGWEVSETGFIHNLWLDVYRESGVIPFIIIIFITIFSIRTFIKYLKLKNKENELYKFLIITLFISTFLLFMVEPIMDGFQIQFLFFILLIGLINGELKNKFR